VKVGSQASNKLAGSAIAGINVAAVASGTSLFPILSHNLFHLAAKEGLEAHGAITPTPKVHQGAVDLGNTPNLIIGSGAPAFTAFTFIVEVAKSKQFNTAVGGNDLSLSSDTSHLRSP